MGLWICRLAPLVQQCFCGEGIADSLTMSVENIYSSQHHSAVFAALQRQSSAFVITKPSRALFLEMTFETNNQLKKYNKSFKSILSKQYSQILIISEKKVMLCRFRI